MYKFNKTVVSAGLNSRLIPRVPFWPGNKAYLRPADNSLVEYVHMYSLTLFLVSILLLGTGHCIGIGFQNRVSECLPSSDCSLRT